MCVYYYAFKIICNIYSLKKKASEGSTSKHNRCRSPVNIIQQCNHTPFINSMVMKLSAGYKYIYGQSICL